MAMTKEQVLDKVRKCLALGNNEGASEAERARALAQAGKLLASVNLTMAAVSESIEERVKETHNLAPQLREWPRAAIDGIARLFFCEAYRESAEKTRGKFHYIGKAVNVATCQMMVEYVVVNIVREAKKRANAAKATQLLDGVAMKDTGYGPEWEFSFCAGASEAVRRKCRELIAQREREGIQSEEGSGTALVLVSLAEQEKARNAQFLEALGVRIRNIPVDAGANAGARAAGERHGSTINLSQQVAHRGGPLALGVKGAK